MNKGTASSNVAPPPSEVLLASSWAALLVSSLSRAPLVILSRAPLVILSRVPRVILSRVDGEGSRAEERLRKKSLRRLRGSG
jgi:hypothetical protein